MIDEEYLNMFIREAKKAYKTIDNKAYNFPITINTAYRLAVNIEKSLNKQPSIIRCKDCIHRGKSEKCILAAISKERDYPVFMLDNRGEWFCADGKPKEGDEVK